MLDLSPRQKAILATLLNLATLLICCSGTILWAGGEISRAVTTDAAQAREIGLEIALYTPPPGYGEIFGLEMLGTQVVVLAPQELSVNGMIITLMKIPPAQGMDEAELQQQLQESVQRQMNWQNLDFQFAGLETHRVNGQPVELTIRTAENANGQAFRQVSGLLESQRGSVFLLAQSETSVWDQNALDTLLETVR
jgi:hypothetical protein